MIFTKHRFEVWNQDQHPLKHESSEVTYSNVLLPGVEDVKAAIDALATSGGGGGVARSITDTTWNGTDTTKTVTVSTVTDARNCVWQLRDNANNFELMGVTIESPTASTVAITVNIPLPAGTYRLIGLE